MSRDHTVNVTMGTVGTVQKRGIAGPICTFSINISALKHFERLIILMTHSVTRKSGIILSCCLSMSCCSPLPLVPFCCHANLAVFAVLTKHLNFHTVAWALRGQARSPLRQAAAARSPVPMESPTG